MSGVDVRKRLSFSSISTYAECGEKWKLGRGYHQDKATWFTTVAGSTVHYMAEQWDRGEAVPSFREDFTRRLEIERAKGVTVKASGDENKTMRWSGGPNKKDFEWALEYGPQIFEAYKVWRDDIGWEILALPDGTLAIELEFDVVIGGVHVKGYVDRIFYDPATDQIIIVDLKTGTSYSSPIQAATYKAGVLRAFGVQASWGGFLKPWATKTTPQVIKMSIPEPIDLDAYTMDYCDYLYEQTYSAMSQGIFLPSPSNMCKGCSVKKWCRAQGAPDAHRFPVWDTINVIEPDSDTPNVSQEQISDEEAA